MGIEKEWMQFIQSKEQAETEASGLEYEMDSDEQDEEREFPYRSEDIRIDQKMISLYQIYRWIQQGKLDLKPDFQRNFVWNIQKKSLLIESLMLRIPIPAFYFDEDVNGQRTVIDGMQRLSTINDFLDGNFCLKGLQYLTSCNGMYFEDLEKKYQGRIEDTQFAVNILDSRCPEMVKFDVFRRINTGGVPLNAQEVRNIMATNETRQFLLRLSTSREFVDATRGRVRDVRMGAQELCLRFLTYDRLYDCKKQEFTDFGDMNQLLDAMIIRLNHTKEDERLLLEQRFLQSMDRCKRLFGECAFSKPYSRNVINRALFTSWSIILANAEYQRDWYDARRERAILLVNQHLEENVAYYNAVTSSTSSKHNMYIQLYYAEKILEELDVCESDARKF